MATGPEAVVQLSEATGTAFVTLDTVGRVLKQSKPALWARSKQGDRLARQSEQARPFHLFNLVLALAIADPITKAAEAVLFWRSMVLRRELPEPPFSEADKLLGNLLGKGPLLSDFAEGMIELAADATTDPDVDSRTMNVLRVSLVQLELRPHATFPCAILHVSHPDLLGRKPPSQHLFLPPDAPTDAGYLPPDAVAPIIRSASLTARLFDQLGGLWADSRRRLAEPVPQGVSHAR